VVVSNNFGPEEYPSTTITGLDPATTYTFTVVAVNTAGDSITSEPSNPVRPLTEREALRQQADKYMMTSMNDFLLTKVDTPPPFNWSDDGCSFPPPAFVPFQFQDPCRRHDFGYRNYGSSGLALSPTEDTRHWIDDVLFVDWLDTCGADKDCERYASDLYLGLRACGQYAFTGDGPFLCPVR
jgi:hypothetical protein